MTISLFQAPSLQAYRERLSHVEPLSREKERELALKYQKGDRDAGRRIVEACLPFVVAIAIEYRRWGIPLEDVIQQGNVGLMRAVAKFDTTKECRLATYAAYWIRAEIREYVVRGYRVVRLGTTKAERRALRAYRTTRESDPERLAAVSGLPVDRVRNLLPLLQARETSLETSKDERAPVVDRIAAAGPSPEDEADTNETMERSRVAVREALLELNDREKLIVRDRLMADEPRTLQDLGVQLGVSKERVRQLEQRTLTKLRQRLRHVA
ncbi:MAG TPA: sigma-70 family RNA polymerase sigma factor [Polyangiaceae bacterium]|nr:sigma-70 family RNA polymerase sigma factor [Polyangiaceae bacterium]